MAMFLGPTRNISRGKMLYEWMAQCCPYLVTPHSPPGLEVNIKSRASSRGQQYVCCKDVGVVCSEDESAVHIKAGRLGGFRQPCTTPAGVRDPRSV